MESFKALARMNPRQLAQQILNVFMVVTSAVMLWKGLGLVTNTESPIVVVLSGSMEPAFFRGDILFLNNPATDPITTGDIVVFKIKGQDIPIVHRVVRAHTKGSDETQSVLTKGDNNKVDDRGLYPRGQLWISRKEILGKVIGLVPWAGFMTIAMNDYPSLKVALVGILGLIALVSREDE